MIRSRREQINDLAEALRNACELTTPVDMQATVNRLGGKLIYIAEGDYEAKIERRGDGFVISLLEHASENRIRFSIAHELGHLFLHMGFLDDEKWQGASDYTDSAYYRFGHSEEEYEAHEFAGAFLMPRAEFAQVARRFERNGTYNVGQIAAHFGVSPDAAITRGRWLGLFSWE